MVTFIILSLGTAFYFWRSSVAHGRIAELWREDAEAAREALNQMRQSGFAWWNWPR